jgi:hypothetical protein
MLTTLHIDCSFNDIPFARHMDSPQNGFYVSGVGFARECEVDSDDEWY